MPSMLNVKARIKLEVLFIIFEGKNEITEDDDSSHGRGYTSNLSQKTNDEPNSYKGDICHIYNKKNHSVMKCYNWFNHSFQSKEATQALAALTTNDSQDLGCMVGRHR
uniref:Uncharacterized protein n=1 Tax=Nymphaea colorata TaxID=210225 RepID=A0A5K1ANA2_9MAGN